MKNRKPVLRVAEPAEQGMRVASLENVLESIIVASQENVLKRS